MTINELRKLRCDKWEMAKAFLEEHRQENGTLTAEDDAAYTKMEDEIQDLGREIERMDRAEKLDAKLSQPVNIPIIGKPGAAAGEEEKQAAHRRHMPRRFLLQCVLDFIRSAMYLKKEQTPMVDTLYRRNGIHVS